jgi:DNA-binding winged helix-turn-helix (wHTH) protein
MASKNVSLQDGGSKLPPAGSSVQFAGNPELELSTPRHQAEEALSLNDVSQLHPVQPSLLDSDSYQVALIPSAERNNLRGVDKLLPAVPPLLLLPLTWKELLQCLHSEASPANFVSENNVMRFGLVRVDLFSMEVSRSDQRVTLTALEFKLLRFLLLNPERVVSRDELLRKVWGYDHYPSTRTVDNYLWRLRQKLESDPVHPAHFCTVRGIGYKFVRNASGATLGQKG